MRTTTLASAVVLTSLLVMGAAGAEPLAVTAPALSQAAGDESVTLNGATFVNHGLVGTGRLPAAAVDFMGDTLGSFSSMALDHKSWVKTADGYKGRLYTLPDRGYNDPDKNFFSDYQGRLIGLDFTFKPYAGADLPAVEASQSQIVMTPTGKGIALTGLDGKPTTGADPAANTVTEKGYVLPVPAAGTLGAGKMSLDAEGLAFRHDGSFYVSDEYAAGIYLFSPKGRMDGMIAPSPALVPITGGKIDYNSLKAPDTGRRNNQGLEALSITPDGKTLFTVLQSATLQDSSAGKNQINRSVTRIYRYDITKDKLPKTPVAVYALEQPIYAKKGDGKLDATAAQSEMVALNDHQFLLLARDSNGQGCGCANPEMFKAVLIVDTSGATNLAGTAYETGVKPIAPAVGDRNVLDPAITPAHSAVLVNLLNPVQLARFGLNIDNAKANRLTLSEKWEAMALAPALDPKAPNDVFLLIGNDNDFLTTKGHMSKKTYDAGLDNDSMLLAYRLTLPEKITLK